MLDHVIQELATRNIFGSSAAKANKNILFRFQSQVRNMKRGL